jgi:outer membrane protein
MRKLLKIVLLTCCGLVSCQVLAANLLEVYNQALISDPTFQIARSQWLSDREQIAISRAGLLPQFDISGLAGRNVVNNTYALPGHKKKFYNNSAQYSLLLDQPLFNYQAWAAVKSANSSVKSSAANYASAALDLINRTVSAYLAILEADDVLRYTKAEKQATASQLERTKARYKVGLATITELDQVRAQYDGVVSQEISNANDLAVKKEQLREITDSYYQTFAKLSRKLPLITPNPADINQWVATAQKQNYDLLAARYNLQAAQENIRAQSAGRYPKLDLQGSMGQQHDNDYNGASRSNTQTTAMLGLTLDFPVVQGGLVGAKSRQATYDYQKASSSLEKTDRSIVSNTRQAYLSVMSTISEVKASRQAVISARSSLASTQESYKVGISTMVDVLGELSKLYEAEKNYASSQYNYLIQTLALKQAAGTLSINDVQIINSWLTPVIKFKPKKPVLRKARTTYKLKKVCKRRTASASEKHLLSINPKHYTIQLMAAKHSQTIMNFMNKHHIPIKAYSYTTYHKGQKLYILILGDYATLKDAHTAIHKLPADIKAQYPWTRSYNSVHNEIRQDLCE